MVEALHGGLADARERDDRDKRECEEQGPQELRVVVVQHQRDYCTYANADRGRDRYSFVGPAQQPSQ